MQLNFKEWLINVSKNNILEADIGKLNQKSKEYLDALVTATGKQAGDAVASMLGNKPQETPTAPGTTPKSVKDQAATLGKALIDKVSGPLTAAVTGAAQNAMTTAKGKTSPGGK